MPNPVTEERVAEALPFVAEWIDVSDPFGHVTTVQAATVAMLALRRAAKDFRPFPGEAGMTWLEFAEHRVEVNIERAIERGELQHASDLYVEAIFGEGVSR